MEVQLVLWVFVEVKFVKKAFMGDLVKCFGKVHNCEICLENFSFGVQLLVASWRSVRSYMIKIGETHAVGLRGSCGVQGSPSADKQ